MPRRGLGSQRAANGAVIGCGVELRVRQYHAHGDGATGRVYQAGQSPGVAPRTLSRSLRQDDLAIHIDHHQPLQKVFVARLLTRMLLDTAYEIGADGMQRQPATVDSYTGQASAASRTAAQSAYPFSQHVVHGVVRQSTQESLHGGGGRPAPQSQQGTPLARLAQPHFGFSESPVGIAHQTENGQQLRLPEWVFAKTTPVGRQNRSGYPTPKSKSPAADIRNGRDGSSSHSETG